jgi:hypothetical protein
MIKSYLKPDNIMLEWGAGVSSLVLAKLIKEYYSIEHDQQWYGVMRKRMRKVRNLKLFHIAQNLPWNRTALDGTFSDGSYEQFKDYVDFPAKLGHRFDVALIDGRARVDCAKALIPLLNRNATVFLHDFERPEYRKILEYYELRCRCRSLAILTLKTS